MKIAISTDHRGESLYPYLMDLIQLRGHEIVAVAQCQGESCDYPDMAWGACQPVSNGEADRAILVCGSGIGMSIAANKVRGIRAAVVHDEIGARMSRAHNDANVLCLSADMLGERLIEQIVDTWLKTPFDGGRHGRRVNKIMAIESGVDPATVTSTELADTDGGRG